MSEINIIKLKQTPEGFGDIADDLEQGMFESALPTQHTHSYYEDKALGLYIGVWDSTSMIGTAMPRVYDEFMTIIEGAAEIKNNQTGLVETVNAGESFVIPQGYDCQSLQNGYLRKFYLIYEPPAKVTSEFSVYKHIISIDEKSILPWQKTSDGHRKKLQYQSHNQKFTSGVWQGEDFNTGIIAFPYNEFISLKHGCLICTDDQGTEHKINTGEALFVPQGVRCSWQAQGKISIHFVQIK